MPYYMNHVSVILYIENLRREDRYIDSYVDSCGTSYLGTGSVFLPRPSHFMAGKWV